MAVERIIKIKLDTSSAETKAKELFKDIDTGAKEAEKSVEDVNKEIDKIGSASDKASDGIDKIGKSTKKAGTGLKSLSGGIKAVGTGIKALGIGLLLALFAALAKIVSENQVVIDFFSTALTAVRIVFNDLVDFVKNDVLKYFGELKKFFEDLTFDKFKKAIKENLIERIESAIEVFGYLSTAIKNLFSGEWDKALEAAAKAGVEFVDVVTGVDDSVEKVATAAKSAGDAIISYATSTIKAAVATTKLNNSAILAEAIQRRLAALYEKNSEDLRRLRDNEFISILDRIEAADKLAKLTEDNFKEESKAKKVSIANAARALSLNKGNVELIAALSDAKNELTAVEAKQSSELSEQQAARIGLVRELLALNYERFRLLIDTDKLQNIYSIEFSKDLSNILYLKKQILDIEIQQDKEGKTAEGNAKIDALYEELFAEQMLFDFKKVSDLDLLKGKLDNYYLERVLLDKKHKDDIKAAEGNKELLILIEKEYQNNYTKLIFDEAKTRKQVRDAEFEHEKALILAKVGAIEAFGKILAISAGKNKKLAAAGIVVENIAAIASIVISTVKGVAKETQKGYPEAIPGMIATISSGAVGVATTIKATVDALSALGESGGGGAGSAAPRINSPQYNVIGENQYNPIKEEDEIPHKDGPPGKLKNSAPPQKVYVLSKDVESAAEFDRQIEGAASI